MDKKVKLITGNSNKPLAQKISKHLGVPLAECEVSRFSDGEIFVKISENIRGMDVFIIQSTNPPGENILELLILLDAARRASAKRITAVIPYFGYARQDRKDQPRVAISAKLMANLVDEAGADRVLTVDLHSPQIQGFFDIPSDHLFSSSIFNDYFLKLKLSNLVTVSPDVGSVKMCRAFAKVLGTPLAIVDKRRPSANRSEIMNIIGEVEGKNVVIRDDMIDTGGTLAEAAETLARKGVKDIYACCTHPVLSGNAIRKIEKSPIKKVIIADTISTENKKLTKKFEIVSMAGLLAEAIKRIHLEESLSVLFEGA
ncbi:MAG: ribose-phosphate pyrophosphokinase [candidate division Zixibacteria bacterium]|nr:ribose-phosphate pyrophosphokinase [candidate division Zixibacteria bacterium]